MYKRLCVLQVCLDGVDLGSDHPRKNITLLIKKCWCLDKPFNCSENGPEFHRCKEVGGINDRQRLSVFEVMFKPIHTFVNILKGIGIRKTEVPFSVITKINSRSNSHLSFLENVKGKGLRILGKLFCIGQYIESTLRLKRQAKTQSF